MSFSNKVNAMNIEDNDFFHNLEWLPTRNNLSLYHILEVCYIGISFIYAGYKTIRILFVDKNSNDNKLYLFTNIINLLGSMLLLFGFFSEISGKGILCKTGITCTLVSTILSTINFIIQEEFKKDLTSSILGCLKCVLDLFLSFVLIKQWQHI